MKTKMILLVVFTAIVTLSFTFVATYGTKNVHDANGKTSKTETVGGLVSEEN